MAEHIVKVLETQYITHDVKRFVVEKPAGYTFIPGQGTDISINLPEWKERLRPFTFTSLNEWQHLEFLIKIYNKNNGVTAMLGKTNAGSELILHNVFGAIQYKGKGVFIAGGAGITPFISILRELNKTPRHLRGNRLIYSNSTSEDLLMDEELQTMLKKDYIKIFTRENNIGYLDRRIDRNFLIENIADFGQHFYVCGPDAFVKDISKLLQELGATLQSIVIEE